MNFPFKFSAKFKFYNFTLNLGGGVKIAERIWKRHKNIFVCVRTLAEGKLARGEKGRLVQISLKDVAILACF